MFTPLLLSRALVCTLYEGGQEAPSPHQWALGGRAGRTHRKQRAQTPYFRVGDTETQTQGMFAQGHPAM